MYERFGNRYKHLQNICQVIASLFSPQPVEVSIIVRSPDDLAKAMLFAESSPDELIAVIEYVRSHVAPIADPETVSKLNELYKSCPDLPDKTNE